MLKLVQGQKLVMAGKWNSSGLNEVMRIVIVNGKWKGRGRDITRCLSGPAYSGQGVLSVGREFVSGLRLRATAGGRKTITLPEKTLTNNRSGGEAHFFYASSISPETSTHHLRKPYRRVRGLKWNNVGLELNK